MSKVRFASFSHGFLFFFFPSSSSLSFFSLFFLFFPSSPTNTCCTRHRGREIDFAAPDIRRHPGVILRFSIAACSPPPPPFSPRIAFVRRTKSCPFPPPLPLSLQPPFNPLRKPNHDPPFPAFSALSMPSWPRGRRLIPVKLHPSKPDNHAIILSASPLRMKGSGIEPGGPRNKFVEEAIVLSFRSIAREGKGRIERYGEKNIYLYAVRFDFQQERKITNCFPVFLNTISKILV